jgi:putative nucleotidyltransferase with HDIG domain
MSSDNKMGSKYTILVVDDEEENVDLLKRTLRKDYDVIVALSGFEALDILSSSEKEIALIISDQRMPGMNGTEFMARSKRSHPLTVRILLTGYADIDAMIDGINKCELYHFFTKPWDPLDLRLIVSKAIESYKLTLTKSFLLKELRDLLYMTIKAISFALDEKDTYTHGHSERVTLYSLILGRAMNLDNNTLDKLQLAGLLHDIGKIGTPEFILNKPGGLTHEEFNTIKKHPTKGKEIIKDIKQLRDISAWLRSHHERYDGTGYPDALKGEEIPLPARILAIADTYDAMTSDRSYRKGLSHETAVEEIKRCAGSQFDPMIVDQFLKKEKHFKEAKESVDTEKTFNEYAAIVTKDE